MNDPLADVRLAVARTLALRPAHLPPFNPRDPRITSDLPVSQQQLAKVVRLLWRSPQAYDQADRAWDYKFGS